ncbi:MULTISPECIES: universal stress protein [unclassified Nocardioides]|uniref:universal stress protein n=1 Tax=unclassified Nocardioides TaxID=2615069 RepID=UPI000057130E|nr:MULTISPECIES: universal stress protein [unclassified Nocardioides]ABL80471.1 UspA domain protein [Nocardioides sp. JS614]
METTAIPSGTVVVGLDGSPSAERALEWAIDQALLESRQLTLAHGVDPSGSVWVDPAAIDHRAVLEALQADAEVMLDHAREQVARRAPDLVVHQVIRMSDARVTLLELSGQAAMVVVGSRGRGPIKTLLLGSVSLAVSREALCPVVVLRPGHPGVVRNGVLVGADGTDRSLATLEFAYRQASLHRLPLTIMHCFWDARPATEGEPVASDVRLVLAESLAGLGEKFPDVQARTELVRGMADERLVRASQRMDLVVVGAHHGGTLTTLLYGSIANAVLEHATCPVAIVPESEG